MSRLGRFRDAVAARSPWSQSRLLALLAVALALGAPLRTMYHLIDVVGDPTLFLVLVGVALLAATGLARVLRPPLAVAVGAAMFLGGLGWYITNLSSNPAFSALLSDTVALLTGQRLLQIAKVRVWVLAFAPAPVFLTWYLALRRWYGTAALAAGTTLGFFVLTTDATLITTLLGVVGLAATLGFGTLDTVEGDGASRPDAGREERTQSQRGVDDGRRAVLEQLAAIIVVPALLSQVPAIAGSSLSFGGGEEATVEGSLVEAGESVSIQGSISLAPTVRYTVESDEPRYWRVASYDRYVGDGWVRTGTNRAYRDDRLDGPPGESRTLRQFFEAESAIGTVPAAWKPTRYSGDADVEVTDDDSLQPVEGLAAGDSYEVSSELLVATPQQLREAGTDYPDGVGGPYTELPASTPDRVAETTATLTANAQNPYETALVVEQWLKNEKAYSLEVDRPDRNVADAFLHEMDAGYCVYFATTMAVMLRTQGIPARMTVGYTSGERVDDGRWVVRGLNSHAWVEVYIPGHGWVQFDPTPSTPRDAAREARIDEARAGGDTSVDTVETQNDTATETPTPEPSTDDTETPTETTSTPTTTETNDSGSDTTPPRFGEQGGDESGGSGSVIPELPSREEAALGVVALLGLAAGARRTGLTERAYRAVWVRYQPRKDPATDVERAFQRAAYVLSKRARPRRRGETVRAYLDAIDASDEVRRLATLREQTRYGGAVTEEMADEAVAIADDVVSGE